jgi:hypothetical protein
VFSKHEGKDVLAASYFKTLSFYDPAALVQVEQSKGIETLSTVQFNKKLEGMTVNKAGTCYVSDKFGDIYSVNEKW